jgi:hypothetical protein
VCWGEYALCKTFRSNVCSLVSIIWSQYGADFVTQLAEEADISNYAALLVHVKCMWQDDCMVLCCAV